MNKVCKVVLPPLLTGVLLVGIWYAAIAVFDLPRYLLPRPDAVVDALISNSSTLLAAAKNTFFAATTGLLSAAVMGFLLALILSSSSFFKAALYPWVLFLQMIPVIVLAPMFVIWLDSFSSVVAVTFMISFFPVVANTTQGMISTDRNLVDLFRVSNASRWQELLFLRIPFALPFYLTGLKISASLAVIGAVTGELFAGTRAGSVGLGFLVTLYFHETKIAELLAAAITACILGFIFVSVVFLLSWQLLRKWHESSLKAGN